MSRPLLLSIASIALVVGSFLLIKPLLPHAPFFSPLSLNQGLSTQTSTDKIIYGFLPYWNLKKLHHPYSQLTHSGIFSITPKEDGTIDTSNFPASTLLPQTDTLLAHTHQEIVITAQTTELITALLLEPKHQQQLIEGITQLLKTYPLEGVNIDFEPDTPVDAETAKNFTLFITALSNKLDQLPNSPTLSIDMYANALGEGKIWQLAPLEPSVDYFIVMAYDYHRPSSTVTGPVAPLYGASLNRWTTDITHNLSELVQRIPSEKLILGLAFYGYQWQTVDSTPNSQTYPKTGETALYHEILELLEETAVDISWDRDALSPYLNFTKDDKNYQLHYEDPQSIGLKLDLVNQSNLGGIAIWALGYEGADLLMWQTIEEKLSPATTSATQSHLSR